MKTRSLIAAGLVATLILSLGHLSQARPGRGMLGNRQHAGANGGAAGNGQFRAMLAQLNLTDDQKAKIKPIVQAELPKVQAIRGDTSLTPDAQKTQMKQIMKESMTQIWPILTPDQQKKVTSMLAQVRQKSETTPAP